MLAIGLLASFAAQPALAADLTPQAAESIATATPIKHLIVVVGENRSFDHVFGTYRPKAGQSIANLLSRGIVRADGSPGANFAAARQFAADPQPRYFIGVAPSQKTPYQYLPSPTLGGAPAAPRPRRPPFAGMSAAQLAAIEPSLEPEDLHLLTTGATGAGRTSGPDPRIANGSALPNGPLPLTGSVLPYDSYTGDLTHRFYQMWQQSDCAIANASAGNPSGCLNDLYPFVATTHAGQRDTGGGTPMAFYNMHVGDAPLLKALADQYTISDNYHQPAMGGSGIQHLFMGMGDAPFWSDGAGKPAVPPAEAIANPDPRPGSNNHYAQDHRFSDCSDALAPGVAAIASYLGSLAYKPPTRCDAGHYYLLNNASPGFRPNGHLDRFGIEKGRSLPPSHVRTIGDALSAKGISWAYYGGGYRAAVARADGDANPADAIAGAAYCAMCNFAAYTASVMGDDEKRWRHIQDAVDFFEAVRQGTLPAVSFLKPDEFVDGHPATSKLNLFEAVVKKLLHTLRQTPRLEAQTALFITFDETGGYYDSGYIQPLDYFGDGPRIPFIAVSRYSEGGRVVHSYADHVSILKFIERNWGLAPLTARSRDNLPNPIARSDNPYAPANPPAIGDLFDMFQFGPERK
ncbi:MAG TPA: alkaline phosphatase family protein [Stellaceae bacterium]|nr:alkaline phosphatase family protein [Stellaceae bacterium]